MELNKEKIKNEIINLKQYYYKIFLKEDVDKFFYYNYEIEGVKKQNTFLKKIYNVPDNFNHIIFDNNIVFFKKNEKKENKKEKKEKKKKNEDFNFDDIKQNYDINFEKQNSNNNINLENHPKRSIFLKKFFFKKQLMTKMKKQFIFY